ncbi:MAG TPA: hypothetical protein VFU22_02520 [Roseiflexaceae bacterium]|nr:hypothetical protein [Roseiflexaceae bacterium]
MAGSTSKLDVYLEIGKKRTLAGAIDWPGWCRGGRDEESALQALLDYAPRYAEIVRGTRMGFHAPKDVADFHVVERLDGNATTDYGVPDMTPESDARPIEGDDLKRFQKQLEAYWQALDAAVKAAKGKQLRKGPRGGGRDLEKIVEHVLGANASYVGRLAWKHESHEAKNLSEQIDQARQETAAALAAAAQGELPERGPRGGALWRPRYFVRRAGWHVLDHVWEIEDRVA